MEAAGPIIIFLVIVAAMAFLAWLPLRMFGKWYRAKRVRYYQEHPEMCLPHPTSVADD